MRPSFHSATVGIVVLALLGLTARVSAEGDNARTAARALAGDGAARYQKGDYQGALDKFKQAYERFPSPKLFFNMGQALRGLSRNVEAQEAFERFLAEAEDAQPEDREMASSHIAELNAKVARVTIGCNREGADVSIDGKKRGTIPIEKPVVVEPGLHKLTLGWKGESKSVEFTATAGQALALLLTFDEKKLPPEPIVAATEAEPEVQQPVLAQQPSGEAKPATGHTWYWIIGGAVVAAVATTLILVYARRDRYPTADMGSWSAQ